MSDKEILRKQLLELRMQIMFAKDIVEKDSLEQSANKIHEAYSKILFEEKSSEIRKGR